MKKTAKKKIKKGKKYEKPLSLFGMSFDEGVGRLLAAKPPKKKK